MSEPQHNRWLNRYALLTAFATVVLIAVGGLVTSKGAGMAVPDWPTSYGYSMFALPIHLWTGGALYEHSHRLTASIVGLLIIGLTRWLGGYESRRMLVVVGLAELAAGIAIILAQPDLKATGGFLSGIGVVVLLAGVVWVRNKAAAPHLVKLGWLVFFLVQFQGLLGGLRVVLFKNQFGIFHAALAQVFLLMLCLIVVFTSRWWKSVSTSAVLPGGLRGLVLLTTFLIFAQLMIGATMRHQHAGLAVPDFPRAYGKVWPATDPASIEQYNQQRVEVTWANPITAFQVGLHMVHRIVAFGILGGVLLCAWKLRRNPAGTEARRPARRIAYVWLGLILAQVALGAGTIWSGKAADIATAHVLVGALSLATGAVFCIVCVRKSDPVSSSSPAGHGTPVAARVMAAH